MGAIVAVRCPGPPAAKGERKLLHGAGQRRSACPYLLSCHCRRKIRRSSKGLTINMNLALVASFYSNGPFVITFACLAELLAYLELIRLAIGLASIHRPADHVEILVDHVSSILVPLSAIPRTR